MATNTIKVTYTLPENLVERFNRLFEKGERSEAVKEALEYKLTIAERHKTVQALKKFRETLPPRRDKRDSTVILRELKAERDAKFGL